MIGGTAFCRVALLGQCAQDRGTGLPMRFPRMRFSRSGGEPLRKLVGGKKQVNMMHLDV
jgi:hypothetical protein